MKALADTNFSMFEVEKARNDAPAPKPPKPQRGKEVGGPPAKKGATLTAMCKKKLAQLSDLRTECKGWPMKLAAAHATQAVVAAVQEETTHVLASLVDAHEVLEGHLVAGTVTQDVLDQTDGVMKTYQDAVSFARKMCQGPANKSRKKT